MKIRVPDYFDDFKCIASECEDTCCAGWGIVIDDESYKNYMNVKGEFGERLRSKIVTEGSENIFVLKGDDCPFLTENKMCDIYNNLGEDSLCYTCRQYPRVMEEFGSLREVCLSLSCPEACRIILKSDKRVGFKLTEDDEEVTRYNDINAMLYLNLMQCRNIVFKILQNRDMDLNKRVSIILKFIGEVQDKIDSNLIQGIKDSISKYSDNKFIEDVAIDIQNYKSNESIKYNNVYEIFKVFKELKHINPNDPLSLEDALRYFWQSEEDEYIYLEKHNQFDNYFSDKIYKFENLLVYFVFRYFMKAVFDYDVLAKIKTALVSYIMIKELLIVRWIEEGGKLTENDLVEIAHTYSKDVEHLEENIETLAEVFETNNVFSIDNLIITLTN
ncbi:flagellin lysine-N-methylase [Clostridium sp. NSJ-6]|uniref:Flagellin lysine-N-methylase n=1 Tax=Clostridium hominis TaxID=2763036 RepID=A0ABR7DD39_9CLOT|nr:flagellin lysine-N-methylase [Clostridium hominis]MBC5629316.1 flagellin lysine-N-methylase [Clostridium hominis]MDU2670921.1 flagellin lysine-N-methylase [Clostridium sp.]